VSDDGSYTGEDEAILRAAATGEGLIPLTPELFDELSDALGATKAAADEGLAAMTAEQAVFVRSLRVEKDYTWRAVAATCALEWGGDWGSNQLYGMAICERAAALLGEDYAVPPWN
jgi:hypothetical protein